METALIALGGVLLGWALAAGTQILRDRRQAQLALMLVHNELLGNTAQLDLAQRPDPEGEDLRLSRWMRRWRLSRAVWDQQGAMALSLLDADAVRKVQDAYHALDAAEIALEEAREGVIAVKGIDLSAPENAEAVAALAAADAETRERLEFHATAMLEAAETLNRALPARQRSGTS
jgi:hypothetical protein